MSVRARRVLWYLGLIAVLTAVVRAGSGHWPAPVFYAVGVGFDCYLWMQSHPRGRPPLLTVAPAGRGVSPVPAPCGAGALVRSLQRKAKFVLHR